MEESTNVLRPETNSRPNTIPVAIIIMLGIVLVLLTCNLGATGYLVYQYQQNPGGDSAFAVEPLPAGLESADDKAALFEQFRELFNRKDNDGLYALLDPLVHVQITRPDFDRQIPLLYQMAGRINSGAYSHYDYQGVNNGKKVFILHYLVDTANGAANLDITIAQDGDAPFTIWGFFLNVQA